MATAAWCANCNAYVWVDSSGGCANGHPRSALHQLYEAAAGAGNCPLPPAGVPVRSAPQPVLPTVSTAPTGVTRVPTKLQLASTLAWLAGILGLLSAVAVGWPQIAMGGSPLIFVLMALAGVALCLAGYFLRRQATLGGYLVVGGIFVSMLLGLLTGAVLNPVLLVSLVAVGITVASWKELG